MKHLLLLFISLLCFAGTGKADKSVITMTTAKSVGEHISFYLAAQINNTPIQVDFGDGTLVDQLIQNSTTLIRGEIASSQTIKIYGNGITYIECTHLQLTSLDVSQCISLIKLNCIFNQLSSLDVSNCQVLSFLDITYNQFTSIDVTNCPALTYLSCNYNKISLLDVTNCTALIYLLCSYNQLTSLDISQCSELIGLICDSNQLTFTTLPIRQATWTTYRYTPQAPLVIPTSIALGSTVDLSTQATINGNATTFTWKTASGTTLSPGTDYTINNGVTTFLKTQSEKVHCEMTNATFPDFTGANVLKTTEAIIGTSSAIDTPTTPSVEMYAVDATLYLNLPTAAQVSVTDLKGRIIASTSAESGSSTLALPGSGLYVVRVMAPNGVTTHKVMVK